MDRAELENLYLKQGKSIFEIAKLKGKYFATIYYWLKKHGIATDPNKIKRGKHSSPKTEFQPGMTPWNKGLTKDTDTRIVGYPAWNEGLTKETDPRLLAQAQKVSKTLKGCSHRDAQYAFGRDFYDHLYWVGGLSLQSIADKLGCDLSAVWYYFNKYGVPRRKGFQAVRRKPTAPELKLLSLLKKHNLPYRYVGNGAVWFEGYNPDFINVDGAKGIIELFGDYWHTTKIKKWGETEGGKAYHFSKFGFKTLIIWENELKNEKAVVKKIKRFTKNLAGVL